MAEQLPNERANIAACQADMITIRNTIAQYDSNDDRAAKYRKITRRAQDMQMHLGKVELLESLKFTAI